MHRSREKTPSLQIETRRWPTLESRSTIFASLLIVAALLLSGASRAAAADTVPTGLDASISKGLAFLAKQQDPDGPFDGTAHRPSVAATSLVVLAFLSCGDVPETGRYGLTVRNAADWLVAQQRADGHFGSAGPQPIPQAMATLALAEAYGADANAGRRVRIYDALVKSVAVICAAQVPPQPHSVFAGGWRVAGNSANAIRPSGWNILALHAAVEAGVRVPGAAFEHASEFILRCYDPAHGGFANQPGGQAHIGSTAIASLCLYLMGSADRNAAKLDAAARYLRDHSIDANTPFAYHAAYFAAQATFQRGGNDWPATGHELLGRLIKAQQPDGGWTPIHAARQTGRTDATALAIGSLALPYRLLPIYQR